MTGQLLTDDQVFGSDTTPPLVPLLTDDDVFRPAGQTSSTTNLMSDQDIFGVDKRQPPDGSFVPEAAKALAAGTLKLIGSMLTGAAGQQKASQHNAAQFGADQLKAMDRIDAGEAVPETEDAAGYQHMTPEQRAIARADLEGAQKAFNPGTVDESMLGRAAQATNDFAEEHLAAAADYENSWTRAIGEGLGSTVPFLLAGPFGAPGAVVGAGLGSLASSGEAVERAIAAGATQEQIIEAVRLGSLPGLTEQLPIETLFGRVPLPVAGKLAMGLQKILGQAMAEGGQEAVQQAAQNLIERYVYDPDQDISEGVAQAAGIGAIIGGGLKAGEQSVAIVKGRSATTPPQDGAQVEPAPSDAEVVQAPPQADSDTGLPGAMPAEAATPAAPAMEPMPRPEGDPVVIETPALTDADVGLVDALPTNPASPPTLTEPAAPQKAVSAEDRAVLRRSQLLDDDIDIMPPEEVAAEVQKARQAGIVPTPEEVQAAATYAAPQTAAVDSVEAPRMTEEPSEVVNARPEPAVAEIAGNGQPAQPALGGDGSRSAPIRVETPEEVAVAGQRVNTEPSDAQKEAGNYQKAHIKLGGLDITIENPKGSTRSGKAPDGREWSVQMPAAYGYVKRTTGRDGDQVDVFVGDDPKSRKVFVIDQVSPVQSGKAAFDEHKAVLGVSSMKEARDLYAQAFSDGRGYQRIGAVTAMSMPQFRKWLADGNTRRPLRYGVQKLTEEGFPADAQGKTKRPMSLVEFLADRGGVADPDGELRAMDAQRMFIPGSGRLVRRGGVSPDEARRAAVEAGYLDDAAFEKVTTSSVDDLYAAIQRDMAARDVFAWTDRDWAEAWRAEGVADEASRREGEVRERVFDELRSAGYKGEPGDAYSSRVTELVISQNLDVADAAERAAIEAVDDAAITVGAVAEDIPFDQEASDGHEVHAGTSSEGRARARAEGERGERSAAEGEAERAGDAAQDGRQPRTEEGKREDRGRPGDREGAAERRPLSLEVVRRENYVRDISAEAPVLYRETNAAGIEDLLTGQLNAGPMGQMELYWANTPDLALGQGSNRGFLVIADSTGVQGKIDKSKPAWEAVWPSAEYVSRSGVSSGSVRAVLVKDDARVPHRTRRLFDREGSPFAKAIEVDGGTLYIRAGEQPPSVQKAIEGFGPRRARPEERKTTEPGAEGKPQTVLPGAERISDKELAERRGAQPMRAKVVQKDPGGLFSDEMDQQNLFSASEPTEPVAALSGAELGVDFRGSDDMPALRAAAQRWYRDNLKGQTAKMQDGTKVSFGGTSMRKSTGPNKTDELLRAVPAIKAIVENGRVVVDESGDRQGVIRHRVINAPVTLAGKRLDLAVTIHQRADGTWHYDFGYARAEIGRPGVGVPGEPSLSLTDGQRRSAVQSAPDDINLFVWSDEFKATDKSPAGWDVIDGGADTGTRLSASEQAELRNIVFSVAGVDPSFTSRIAVPRGTPGLAAWGNTETDSTAAGFYSPVNDAITLALDSANRRTAYHEAFHRLQNLFLTDAERRLLRGEQDRLRQIVATNSRRADAAGKMSQSELEAEAFAIWSDRQDKGDAGGFRLHIGLRRAWQRIRNMMERVRNYLDGRGYRTVEDVFGEAREGKIAQRPKRARIARAPLYSIAETGAARSDLDRTGIPRVSAVTAPLGKRIVRRLKKGSSTEKDGEGAGEYWVRQIEDYLDPVRRVVREAGGTVSDLQDAYLQARLAEDTALARIHDLHDTHVTPMVEALAVSGASLEEFHRYLYAMHAEERNRVVGLRNEEGSDLHRAATDPTIKGASGWSTNEARQALRELSADPKKLAGLRKAGAAMRELMDRNLLDQKKAGLISADTYDLLTKQWSNYIPLKAEDGTDSEGSYLPGRGKGFSVSGSEFKAATGRYSEAENIPAWAIAAAERTQIRAEKNNVGKAMLRLINEHDPKGERIAKVYWSDGEGFGDIQKAPAVYRRELDKHGKVVGRKVPPSALSPDMLPVKVGGRQYHIQFADEKVGAALKKLGVVELNAAFRALRYVSMWQSIVNTRLNPEFVPVNIARDVQTGAIHLLSEGSSVRQSAAVVASIPKAWAALWRQSRGKAGSGEWDRAAKEFRGAGGRIIFDQYKSIDESMKALRKAVADRASGKMTPLKAWRTFVRFIEDVFDAGENGIRLAAYKAARDRGMTAQRAAFMARDLTVDFKKRGEVGNQLNAWSVFFNAAYQGNINIARRLAKSGKVRAAAFTIAASGLLLDALNRALSGEDDDGESFYSKMVRNEPWKLERQIVLFYGSGEGDYITIPLPYGYNAIYNVGLQAGATLHKDVDPLEAISSIARVTFDAYNPLGTGGHWLNIVMPTALDPFIEIGVNTNFFGAPITPTLYPGDVSPDSYRHWQSTPDIFRWVADMANKATGGNEIEPGALDMSPDTYEHLWGFVSGGIGRFFGRVADTAGKVATGRMDEIEPENVPWVRSFYGRLDEDSHRAEYYRQREQVRTAKKNLENYNDQLPDEAEAFIERNRVAVEVIPAFDAAEKQLRKLRKAKRSIERDDGLTAEEREGELKQLEADEREIMTQARLAYAEARRAAE
jgi:hypothetical protein